LNIIFYETESFFSDLSGEWQELLENSYTNVIFLTYEWLVTWWETYHPGQIWALALRDDSGRCMGIVPWFRAEKDGQRIICPIGCVDVTDYLDVIVRRGAEQEVLQALAAWVGERRELFDVLYLRNVPQDSPTLNLLPELFHAQNLVTEMQLDEVCPVIPLPDTFEDYVASLDKKNRHELRRKIRRATGVAEWYIVGKEHDLNAEVEKFLKLMVASSPDKAAFLSDPQNSTFFRRITPALAKQGWLQLAFITVQGEPAAGYLNFDYQDRIMVYNSGLDPAVHGQISPGIVLLARLIEHAIESGCKLFDLLRGDESYKYDMGGQNTEIYQIEVRGRG
jgi:CelD/BcsL family acetyltransferase involved in cellulose biosynthesis